MSSFLKIVAASLIMGLMVLIVGRMEVGSPLIRTAFLLGVGALSYGVACFALRIEEADKLWKMCGQFIIKKVNLF